MEKNHIAYYRVAENLINFSSKSQELLKIIGVIFDAHKIDMISSEEISLVKLMEINLKKDLKIQN